MNEYLGRGQKRNKGLEMANYSNGLHECISLPHGIYHLSNFLLMGQQLLVILAVLGASYYLLRKFFQKPKGGATCDKCANS